MSAQKGSEGGSIASKRRAWAAQLYELKLTWLEAERKRRVEWMEAKGGELLRLLHEHRIEVQALQDLMSDGGAGHRREALAAAAAEHEAALEALKEQVDVGCMNTSRAPAIVYVLSCECGKFYVGRCVSDRFERRMQEHMGDSPENKAEWTRRYPVIGVIEQQPCWDPLDENMRVLSLMREKGVDNVRGGPWPMCDLGLWRNEIDRQLGSASDKCFYCHSTSHFASECTHKRNAAGKPAAALEQLCMPPSPQARPPTPCTPPPPRFESCPSVPPLQPSSFSPAIRTPDLGLKSAAHPWRRPDSPTKKRPRCRLADRLQPELLADQFSGFSLARAPSLHPSEAGPAKMTLSPSLAMRSISEAQREHGGLCCQRRRSPIQAPISKSWSARHLASGAVSASPDNSNWDQQPRSSSTYPAMPSSCHLLAATAHPLQPAFVPHHSSPDHHACTTFLPDACTTFLPDAGQAHPCANAPRQSVSQTFSQSVAPISKPSQQLSGAAQGCRDAASSIIALDHRHPPNSQHDDLEALCMVQDVFDEDMVEGLGLLGAGKEAEQAPPEGPQDVRHAGLPSHSELLQFDAGQDRRARSSRACE
ncbi:hypothetical protein DUNSADRAFT_2900 [Dunaliella salina]|uniref:GIY-YIG domain-containing protein n=1 Tax=Dunaliella salina TaxID=3046 RepID=A0ABQ7GUZ0_DUNSA|nr:hypothetical protein DUNSADRAFT_2900 [Dunaliella salina]|eukprot:KAF5838432.1 hypothetical protein DUNSADRAFT_2900 [Dunaliella salina]